MKKRVVIIGSGFSGIAMGAALERAGIEDFVILEQADEVGGTWRDNHYPGAACDIESHLYAFSFAPNPNWSRTFAPQAEILAYLRRCVDDLGLRSHLLTHAEVMAARFDDRKGRWRIDVRDRDSIDCQVVVPCCGGLSRPRYPDIAGIGSFAGKTFHSARWDDAYPLAGKRVGVVGTGASAIQIVPAIAGAVGHLTLFQRTPPWIIPKRDFAISPGRRALYQRLPLLQRGTRARLFWKHELFALGFVVAPPLLDFASRYVEDFISASVADPVLSEKLTPRYRLGCKRVLMSNDYYPALQRENVTLECAAIERIVPDGVVTADGLTHALDALIFATGFVAAEAVAPFVVLGRGGRDLNDAWRDGPVAYKGTSVAGFPNLFMIVGPNTGLGHSSMILMIEAQARYITSALLTMQARRLATVEVRQDAQDRFNERLQARFPRTAWDASCHSWYYTRSGKNTTLWPGFTLEYRARTRRFDARQYALSPERTAPEVVPEVVPETAPKATEPL